MVSNQEIKDAYAALMAAKERLYKVAEGELNARAALKIAENAVILQYADEPKKLGGNEPARNAAIREKTLAEFNDLEEIEAEKRKAQLAYDLAVLSMDCLKWQIRNEQAAADCEAQGLGAI
jgi:hypothetical protein